MDYAKLKKLLSNNELDKAMDYLYDSIDDLMLAGKFNQADDILTNLMKENFSTTILVGALTITFVFKNKLSNREDLLKFTEDKVGKNGLEGLY